MFNFSRCIAGYDMTAIRSFTEKRIGIWYFLLNTEHLCLTVTIDVKEKTSSCETIEDRRLDILVSFESFTNLLDGNITVTQGSYEKSLFTILRYFKKCTAFLLFYIYT